MSIDHGRTFTVRPCHSNWCALLLYSLTSFGSGRGPATVNNSTVEAFWLLRAGDVCSHASSARSSISACVVCIAQYDARSVRPETSN